ncbi:uncharacterized protein LOC103791347 isoform X3 [Callithrix jacchus]
MVSFAFLHHQGGWPSGSSAPALTPPPLHMPALCPQHPGLPEGLQQLPQLTVTLCFLDFKKEVAGMFGVMSPEAAIALYWKTSKRDDTHRSTRGVLLEEISLEGLRKKGQNATWWKSSRTNPQLRMSHHRGSLIPCLGQNHFTAKSQDLEREYPARTTLAQRNPPRKKLGLLPVEDPRWPNRNSSGVQFPARTMQRSHSRTHAGARGWGTQKVEETIGRKCVLQDHPIANLHEGDVLPT